MWQIVHFGLGNFARAHVFDYTADAGGGLQVTGVNLRSSATLDGLAAQDFKYALNVQGTGIKQISVIKTVLLASESQQAVLEAMANADIISATVTEKGYHLDQNGQLDVHDPVIAGNHLVMHVKLSILIQMVALFGDGCRDDISIGHCF